MLAVARAARPQETPASRALFTLDCKRFPSQGQGPIAPRSCVHTETPPGQVLHGCRGRTKSLASRKQRSAALASQGRWSPDVWGVLCWRFSPSQLECSSFPDP